MTFLVRYIIALYGTSLRCSAPCLCFAHRLAPPSRQPPWLDSAPWPSLRTAKPVLEPRPATTRSRQSHQVSPQLQLRLHARRVQVEHKRLVAIGEQLSEEGSLLAGSLHDDA